MCGLREGGVGLLGMDGLRVLHLGLEAVSFYCLRPISEIIIELRRNTEVNPLLWVPPPPTPGEPHIFELY